MNLRDVALAFPVDVKGRRYRLEDKSTRMKIGSIEATCGAGRYKIIVSFTNGERMEAIAAAPRINTIDVLGRGGKVIGSIRSTRSDLADASRPVKWEVYLQGRLWGVIERSVIVRETLSMLTVEGGEWPIRLNRAARFSEFLMSLMSLLTLTIWRPPSINDDTVIPEGTPVAKSAEEDELFFMVNVVFRMLVFPFNFAYKG